MKAFLVDGTYELFRQYFGVPSHITEANEEIGAVRGVLGSVLALIDDGGTHVGVATDKVIESFRNRMYHGYKTGEGIDPILYAQFPLLEEGLEAMGVKVWAMTDLEADDALASAAAVAKDDERVEQVVIFTPDKDLGQCVDGARVVQYDRRKQLVIDELGVQEKFGVLPKSIPDYLGLVGDSADGFPGIQGWGAKSTAAVLAHYEHIENIPDEPGQWEVTVRGSVALASNLAADRKLAMLFKDLATLRIERDLLNNVDDLRWNGPTSAFAAFCKRIDGERLLSRAQGLASR